MDEDIDDFSLADATSPYLAPPTFESETRAPPPQQFQSQSFRSSSYRPTSLASAYDTLLATSLSRASPLAHFTPPPTSSFSSTPKTPSLGYFSRTPDTGSRYTAMGTTPREDARVRNEFVDPPDRIAAREEELKLRDVLAMDVPSHRTPLASRRRVVSQEKSDEEEEEEDDQVEELPQASRFAIGSLPMNIMQPPPSRILALSSSFRPEPELDLTRKTSVPGTKKERIGLGSSYIPPTAVSKAKNILEEEKVEPKIELDMSRKIIGTRNEVRSELGMSLRNGNGNGALLMSQGREALDESEEVNEEEQKSEDGEEEEYLPPHMWREKNIKPEDLLSRSVSM